MKTRLTFIFASVILLVMSANVFAEGWEQENAPPIIPEIIEQEENIPPAPPGDRPVVQARQRRRLQQQGAVRGGQGQQVRTRARVQRQQIQARAGVERQRIRAKAGVERHRIRAQAGIQRQQIRSGQRQSRPAVQTFNRWFEALKEAYAENDKEKVGNLIRKMEQLKNNEAQQPGRRPQGGPAGQQRGGRGMQSRQRLQGGAGQVGPQGQPGAGAVRQRQRMRLGRGRGAAGEGPAGGTAQRPGRQLRRQNRRGQIQEQENDEEDPDTEEFEWDF